MREGGLEPIVHCARLAAEGMEEAGGKTSLSQRELDNLEELGAQCARSLRNLSANRISSFFFALSELVRSEQK